MTTQHLPMEALVLGPDEGTHLHFLNHLATIKVAGEAGSMNVVEFLAPGGFGPPLHSHRHEDELFVILEGEVSVRSGDIEGLAGPGSCVFLPSGRPRTFQNLSELSRMVTVTSRTGAPATFDWMVTELGVRTSNPGIPAPKPIDPDAVAAICARHDIDIARGDAAFFPLVHTVLIAPPTETGYAVEGSASSPSPGGCDHLCDPDWSRPRAYLAAAAEAEGGQPEVQSGLPHIVSGMYAEMIVTG